MSFLYPRTIVVKRPTQAAGVGNLGHIGVQISEEVVIVSGISASIQLASSGRNSGQSGLIPADSPGPIKWSILIAASDVANLFFMGIELLERDVIYDDLISPQDPNGRRFQIAGYQPDEAVGGRIDCVRLLV